MRQAADERPVTVQVIRAPDDCPCPSLHVIRRIKAFTAHRSTFMHDWHEPHSACPSNLAGLAGCAWVYLGALKRKGIEKRDPHLLRRRCLLRRRGRVPQLLRDLLRPWRGRMCRMLWLHSTHLPGMHGLPDLDRHCKKLRWTMD